MLHSAPRLIKCPTSLLPPRKSVDQCCRSFSVQDYCKSNEPVSLKLGVMTGSTNQKNLLTFGGDMVPDTDSGSLF